MKHQLVVLTTAFISLIGNSQLTVHHINKGGNVQVVSKGNNPKSLKTNDIINTGQTIIINGYSEITVRNNKHHAAYLSSANDKSVSYSYAQLEKQLVVQNNKKNGGVLKSGIDHMSKHLEKKEDVRKDHRYVPGGVRRGCSSSIYLFTPSDGIILTGDSISFSWNSVMDANSYYLTIYDSTECYANKTLYPKPEIKDTVFTISLTDLNVKDRLITEFSWRVYHSYSRNKECPCSSFKVISESERNELVKAVDEQAAKADSPIEILLTKAALFEERGLYEEAATTYDELVKLDDRLAFRDLQALFLARSGISPIRLK